MESNQSDTTAAAGKRLKLSRVLGAAGFVLLLLAYLLGPVFAYRSTAGYETEINNSYRPFSMFALPKDEQGRPREQSLINYLSGYHSVPAWRVSLEAPQYPKVTFPDGIPVYFNLTRFTGEVQEMNTINHYIGMEPMEVGAPWERRLVPFIVLVFLVSIAVFIVYDGPAWWIFGIGPALMPVYFIAVFSYWLYWFGHNLHEWGAFTIKPFMPTVLGNGKVAQFTTHSYPYMGFYLQLAIMVALVLAVFIKRRALNDLRAPPAK
jgi:hypothetical protein